MKNIAILSMITIIIALLILNVFTVKKLYNTTSIVNYLIETNSRNTNNIYHSIMWWSYKADILNWYSTLSNYGRNYMFHSIEWNVIVYKNIDNEEFVWYNLTTDNLSFWYKPIY